LYEYAFGDPVNLRDASGLEADLILVSPLDPPQPLTAVTGMDFVNLAMAYRSEDGTYSVVAHGDGYLQAPTTDGQPPYRFINPDQLAEVISLDLEDQSSKGRRSKTPRKVKLVGCSVERDYAERLATDLGVPVTYSTEPVVLLPNGNTRSLPCFVLDCTDDVPWRTAKPRPVPSRRR
jgi:hypothetical protein